MAVTYVMHILYRSLDSSLELHILYRSLDSSLELHCIVGNDYEALEIIVSRIFSKFYK